MSEWRVECGGGRIESFSSRERQFYEVDYFVNVILNDLKRLADSRERDVLMRLFTKWHGTARRLGFGVFRLSRLCGQLVLA